MLKSTFYIPQPSTGRRFAISDIHGCVESFRALVSKQIRLTPSDQLFLLGDYVHRGPDSLGVLDYIMDLEKTGFQIYPLAGNHEDIFLEGNQGKVDSIYIEYLKNLSQYYQTDSHWLVHAGFNFGIDNPLEDAESFIWGPRRYSKPPESFLQGRQIICGHRVHKMREIQRMISEKQSIIVIDNGCYHALKSPRFDTGNLLALNLDTSELLIQPNIDKLRGNRWENW